jgi:hypothetical protein
MVPICERCLYSVTIHQPTIKLLPDGTRLYWHAYCYNVDGEVEKFADRVARASIGSPTYIPGLIEE